MEFRFEFEFEFEFGLQFELHLELQSKEERKLAGRANQKRREGERKANGRRRRHLLLHLSERVRRLEAFGAAKQTNQQIRRQTSLPL